MIHIHLQEGKKIYFASDFHLGAPNRHASLLREKQLLNWLDEIKKDAQEIFLLGDIFDFWFEYRQVVPKGFVRILGKLAEMTDAGITIRFFLGNHDLWSFGYLEKEIGMKVYREPKYFNIQGKKFLIGHGDGLGPRDYTYKFIKKIFVNKINQRLFAFLHPTVGLGIANFFSRLSYTTTNHHNENFVGPDKEWLYVFAQVRNQKRPIDYYIFGHRHLSLFLPLADSIATYINTGDWLKYQSYVIFDGEKASLEDFKKPRS